MEQEIKRAGRGLVYFVLALCWTWPAVSTNAEPPCHILDVNFRRVQFKAVYTGSQGKDYIFRVERIYLGSWTDKEVSMPAYHWRDPWGELVPGHEFVMTFSNNPLVDAVFPIRDGMVLMLLGGNYGEEGPKWSPFSEIEALILQRVQKLGALQLGVSADPPLRIPATHPDPFHDDWFTLQNLGTEPLTICMIPLNIGFDIEKKTDRGFEPVKLPHPENPSPNNRSAFITLEPDRSVPVRVSDELTSRLDAGEYRIRAWYSNPYQEYEENGKQVPVSNVWTGHRQTEWFSMIVDKKDHPANAGTERK